MEWAEGITQSYEHLYLSSIYMVRRAHCNDFATPPPLPLKFPPLLMFMVLRTDNNCDEVKTTREKLHRKQST